MQIGGLQRERESDHRHKNIILRYDIKRAGYIIVTSNNQDDGDILVLILYKLSVAIKFLFAVESQRTKIDSAPLER